MPFDGLRGLSFESRRAAEIEKLICARGGADFVPFAERLFAGDFNVMVFFRGVGSRFR
jgi:uroporphyrinogen-III synthase